MFEKRHSFMWPAEWAPHTKSILSWPLDMEDWQGAELEIDSYVAELAGLIAESEPVLILNVNNDLKSKLLQKHPSLNRPEITFSPLKTDSIWTRDYAPIWVSDANGKVALNPQFNGWSLYEGHGYDAQVGRRLGAEECVDVIWKDRHVVLEGGGIDGNGIGVILSSEQCLLSSSSQVRNPGFSKEDYEALFAHFLGAREVLWIKDGLLGDDTNGHIDDVARFVNETTILFSRTEDNMNPNYIALEESYAYLTELVQERLRRGVNSAVYEITILDLPLPDPIFYKNDILPASYANFYITNSSVIVPTFNQKNDDEALGIIGECFPGRKVVAKDSRVLLRGLGGIHCCTMQVPDTT